MRFLIIILFLLFSEALLAQSKVVNDPYENGLIKDGFKEGTWEYYDEPGKLSLKINYDSSKLLFLKQDTSEYVIQAGNQWVKEKLDRQPRYIGSMNDFHKLEKIARYPADALNNNTCGKLYITFEVDTSGKAGNYQIINDIGDHCGDEIAGLLKVLPNYWLPAQKDGQLYAAKFMLPVLFKMIIDGKEIKPKKDIPIASIPFAKELPVMIVKVAAVSKK